MERTLLRQSCLFGFLFLISSLTFAGQQSVEVLSSDDSSLRFRVYNTVESIGLTGDSLPPSKTVLFGVPIGARVELVGIVPGHLISQKSLPLNMQTDIDPAQIVKISKPTELRGRRIASIELFPLGENGLFETIDVSLRFTGSVSGGASADDPKFDNFLASTLINYQTVKNWPVAVRANRQLLKVAENPFNTVSLWHKIGVNNTGLIRVTGAQLQAAGLSLTNLASDDIHLFSGGGLQLPAENASPRPEMREVAIQVNDGGDGLFNATDNILFYGEDVDRWVFGAIDSFYNNVYTDENIYWLTVSASLGDGLRMTQRSGIPNGSGTPVLTFTRKVHAEAENVQRIQSDGKVKDYYTWFWSADTSATINIPTTGAVIGQTAQVAINAEVLDIDLLVNNAPTSSTGCILQKYCLYNSDALIDGLSQLRLTLRGISSIEPYLDNVNITYESYFKPLSNKLDFILEPGTGEAAISIVDQIGNNSILLDIDDPLRPEIITTSAGAGTIDFEDMLDPVNRSHYFISSSSVASAPSSITAVAITDLRANLTQTDLLIVTPTVFENAMTEYIDYRRSQGYSVKIVSVEQIMDNFSWGLYDPIAIRDFLKFAYENYATPRPLSVLFVGDGSYDFMNYLGTNQPNFVPPFIHPIDDGFTSSDDNYVYFGDYGRYDSDSSQSVTDRGFDMITSRWPVKSSQEIAVVTDKIKRYEASTNFGAWRTNITLVADDEIGSFSTETIHVIQSEALEKSRVPSYFTRDKIYLWDYPRVNNTRPDVNNAIVDQINSGTLLVNFVGHGNPDVWAHEHVFERLTDLPRLHNFERLPLIFAASCDIGFFDDPKREGMAEDLLMMPGGGAIGVISATRLVYSSQNHLFNLAVFDHLFTGELSIAEALYAAKLERSLNGNNRNDRKYMMLGDPLLKLGVPHNAVVAGNPPSSMTALAPVNITGQVEDADSAIINSGGTLLVNVFDSDRKRIFRLYNSNNQVIDTVAYTTTGPTIFRGRANINAGEFDFSFIPPLDIGYGGSGARISLYAQINGSDAVGTIDSMRIADTIAVYTDNLGPEIEIKFGSDSSFVSGSSIRSDDDLIVTLSDSSGINLAGGIGHGITLEIDGQADKTVNLTPLFEYDTDDYTRGNLSYTLENLTKGNHNFVVKAWDNANNPELTSFSATVAGSESLAIMDLLNYPNPMNQSTTFSYRLNRIAERFSLEIFTLSGRKIKSFERYGVQPVYHDDIKWNGDDADGRRVSTGVYIYKASAVPETGGESAESYGKVVVVN